MTFRRSKPKRFCSLACASWGKRHLVANPDKQQSHSCPTCGVNFTFYKSWPRIYCSRACAAKQRPNSQHELACEQCGAAFISKPGQPNRFCSRSCFGASMSAQYAEHGHPRKGKPGKSHPGPRVDITCVICGKIWQDTPVHASRRVCCSRACLGVLQAARNSGENNPLWKGGRAPYYGPTWWPAKRAARLRDKVCQRCGNKPQRALDVHHIVPFRAFGLARHAEANQLSNLVALCNKCHLEIEWETNRTNPEYGLWSDHEPLPSLALAALKRHPNPVMRGKDNPRSARTDDDIREIRRSYAAKEANQVQLATRFHTSQTNISAIIRRKAWAHIP